ncbi:hypothetical protein TESG_06208 [Trichophyton tonsurans CBS 112818]|uniref:Uncharacterized protein n=1 Tax=Trichophyton tonsurans (strain CBS 112818) TaxID=647933 RepID=F2S5J5_TRIT1|nr:hypothetical protein TESG_06208 [Trichophyton tonsurans CBS 112818]
MPLLPKKFPALVAKPIAPFFVAALVVGYGINSLQNAMMNCDRGIQKRSPKPQRWQAERKALDGGKEFHEKQLYCYIVAG